MAEMLWQYGSPEIGGASANKTQGFLKMAQAGIVLAGESNIGMVRRRNEDSYALVSVPGRRSAFAVISDGVGGHQDGDVASNSCTMALLRAYLNCESSLDSPESVKDFFNSNITDINRRMFLQSQEKRLPQPMACTVISGIFLPDHLIIAAAGDSRCYRFTRQKGLEQLSSDHVLTGDMLKKHGIVPNTNAYENTLLRAVGAKYHLEVDIRIFDRLPDARYLFCSDGLSHFVSDEKIAAAIAESHTPCETVDRLMRLALLAGGRDNATLISAFPLP